MQRRCRGPPWRWCAISTARLRCPTSATRSASASAASPTGNPRAPASAAASSTRAASARPSTPRCSRPKTSCAPSRRRPPACAPGSPSWWRPAAIAELPSCSPPAACGSTSRRSSRLIFPTACATTCGCSPMKASSRRKVSGSTFPPRPQRGSWAAPPAGRASGWRFGRCGGSAEVAQRGPPGAAPARGAWVQAAVSGRGDRDLTRRARFRKSGIAVSAGAETVAGPAAPERRAAVLGLEAEAISGLTVQIEARVMPEQQRVSSAGGELWLRHGGLSAGALARTTSFGSQQLVALGAGLEIAGEVLGLESAVRATAWRLHLTAPRSRDPWNEFGQRTLDWADRWEARLTLRRPLGPLALTASAGVAQSARWNLGGGPIQQREPPARAGDRSPGARRVLVIALHRVAQVLVRHLDASDQLDPAGLVPHPLRLVAHRESLRRRCC